MSKKSIPPEVKKQVDKIVEEFNQTVISNPHVYYLTRYRGRFLYLERFNYGRSGPICRLTYTGSMDNWDFAIFKYSNERYDSEEWFFPGAGHVDGTIEGAMKAGLELILHDIGCLQTLHSKKPPKKCRRIVPFRF